MNNTDLSRIFQVAGSRFGYSDVTAEFSPFRDFKIRWQRNYKWARFEVSDYLNDAPMDVVASLAETIFSKIKGDDASYPDQVCEWLSSRTFLMSKQPVYIKRFTGLSISPAGNCKNLRDSHRRLIDSGLLEDDRDVYLGWARQGTGRAVGRASVLMKVVAMSEAMDDERIDDDLLDYSLYSQMAHVGMGFNTGTSRRGVEYDDLLSRYPRRQEMESELRRLGLHI